MTNPFINILIAEDNDVSREMMAAPLRALGFQVYGAIDGESAIKVVEDRAIDLALIDVHMAPKGGFEFVKYLVVHGMDIPVVIITADDNTNILSEAAALGVVKVMQKPVDPVKIVQIAQRILKRRGLNPAPLAVTATDARLTPDQAMARAIELADRNAKSKRGGPFGAVVTDADGKILGEGVNGITSRVDPIAHAEVMAIRHAADRLGRADLSDCVLYCSSYPTMMGQALIASVGIKTVYYGLSADDVRAIRTADQTPPRYIQNGQAEAMAVYKNWQSQKIKIAD